MGRTKSKKNKLLANQKPRLTSSILYSLRYKFLILITLSGLCYLVVKAGLYFNHEISTSSLKLTALASTGLDNREAVQKHLKASFVGDRHQLRQELVRIQDKLGANTFQIFYRTLSEAYVRFDFLEASACIVLDKMRKVSKNGQVYGNCSKKSRLPMIKGIARPDQPSFWADATIILAPESVGHIKESLELLKLTKDQGYLAKVIEFFPFQGFTAHLDVNGLKVDFGMPPFEKKITKLNKLMQSLDMKEGERIRIELDYSEKVFVKRSISKS